MPLAGLGITIWATTANGGVSASGLSTAREPTSRIVYAFSVIAQFNSVMGSNSALLVTVPDFARYARSSRDQILGQMLGLPLSILCAAFGCITTVRPPSCSMPDIAANDQSAVLNMYGEAYWNPYDLLNGILDRAYTPKSRAGVFFAAAAWAFATFGTSVACNIARGSSRWRFTDPSLRGRHHLPAAALCQHYPRPVPLFGHGIRHRAMVSPTFPSRLTAGAS